MVMVMARGEEGGLSNEEGREREREDFWVVGGGGRMERGARQGHRCYMYNVKRECTLVDKSVAATSTKSFETGGYM